MCGGGCRLDRGICALGVRQGVHGLDIAVGVGRAMTGFGVFAMRVGRRLLAVVRGRLKRWRVRVVKAAQARRRRCGRVFVRFRSAVPAFRLAVASLAGASALCPPLSLQAAGDQATKAASATLKIGGPRLMSLTGLSRISMRRFCAAFGSEGTFRSWSA